MPQIDTLLEAMHQSSASDLHLKVGIRPRYRIHGRIEENERDAELTRDDVEQLTRELLSTAQAAYYAENHEIDFSYGNAQLGRFRCNCFQDYWGPAAVFRSIPARVPTMHELRLPDEVGSFAHLHRGLVLVTGSSGTGKTSTLASIIDTINQNYRKHIITLEDPIEYLHPPKKSVVHQRGMHYDIVDFESGIVDATRQDPDVILIGELRDLPSIRQALTAAELGILVFATLHTNSAADSIDRIVDVFPPNEQPQVQTMLSQCLEGVVCQALLPRIDGDGRVPATEILKTTPAVSNMIREGKTQDLSNAIQSGRSHGMHTLDDSLRNLVEEGVVDPREAYSHANNKASFEKFLGQGEEIGTRRGAAARV